MPNVAAVGAKSFADDATEILRTVYTAAAKDANLTGIDMDYLDKNAAKYSRARGAELVGMKATGTGAIVPNPNAEWAISETTRAQVNELLQEALDEGISHMQFKERLDDLGVFSEARATMIARTEIGIAQNAGHIETYKEIGFTHVKVHDGDCDVCSEVDGQVWTIDEAAAEPLAHPNCVRAFVPTGDMED